MSSFLSRHSKEKISVLNSLKPKFGCFRDFCPNMNKTLLSLILLVEYVKGGIPKMEEDEQQDEEREDERDAGER